MSPLPGTPWPFYEPEPPTYACIGDPSVVHEGDEWRDCDSCTPPDCADCLPGSMCGACDDDRRFHEDRDTRLEERG